jgi:RNA polymerase sigma-70 factor (ECF subfamily)
MPANRGSDHWVERLRPGAPRRDETVADLHRLLLRVAYYELSRRRSRLPSLAGPEFDDVAHQAADDALVSLLDRLDRFRGESRFTTWAYKFVLFEISSKLARHAWRREPPSGDDLVWDRLVDVRASQPEDRITQRERMVALSCAIAELSERQRVVFVALALNEVPVDVVVLRLRSNRNAVYKNLFDARRNVRAKLVAGDHLPAPDCR